MDRRQEEKLDKEFEKEFEEAKRLLVWCAVITLTIAACVLMQP